MKRNREYDILRGILILLVVIAHYNNSLTHDIIFLFHMPLFFILSGYLLRRDKLCDSSYLKSRAITLMIPYAVYLFLDRLVIRQDYSLSGIVHTVWGGRALSGTYWYITCFIVALTLFGFILKHFSDRTTKLLIVSWGGVAVIESHLAEHIHILQSPGIPWNMDVALLALVYLAIGFYYKVPIKKWLEDDNRKLDIIALIISVFLIAFCVFNYWGGRRLYYFDMKPLYYKELLSAVLIPCAFGIVLCRIVFWIARLSRLRWLENALAYLGQMTIPIIFMHVPLNTWKEWLGYGRAGYILIGIGIPVICTLVCNRFTTMRKLFGLPIIRRYSDKTET